MLTWYDANSTNYQTLKTRLLIIVSLGFSSGVPFALTSSTLQAWFADTGHSVMATGMLSLIGLPYIIRFVWAPWLDRYPLFSLGKRRSWILSMQLIICLLLNLMAWISPEVSATSLIILSLLLAFCSSTQDTAIDAHRIEYLIPSEQGLGASLAVFGYRMALFITGGLVLIIAQQIGWAFAYRAMSLLMLIGIIAILQSPEPSTPIKISVNRHDYFLAPIKELIHRPNILALAGFVLFYKLGEAFTCTNSGIIMPFLIQGLHISLANIAFVNKIMGIISIVAGGLVSGVLLLRWSLRRALLVFGLLQSFTNLLFIVLAMLGNHYYLFATAVICDNFAAGLGSTALIAFLMQCVDSRFTATQFSILVALSTLPRIASGPLGAFIQMHLGWIGLFQLAFFLSLLFIPFLFRLRIHENYRSSR